MKTLLFIVGILLLGHPLAAQSHVVAVQTLGKVSYYAPKQKTAQSVYPGMRMLPDGRLQCQSGSTVKLLYKGETFTFADRKVRVLRELDQLLKGSTSIGFLGRFWSFLTSSMSQTNDEETLEKGHRQCMESVYASVQGFASQQQYAIQSGFLYSSRLGAGDVTFSWSGAAAEQMLLFQITSAPDSRIIASATVRGSAYSINLSQIALVPGKAYEWQVLPADGGVSGSRSAKTSFLYDPKGVALTLAAIAAQDGYRSASPTEQALMEAFALETEGYHYEAAQRYAAHTDNALVRSAHAAFLSRMDLLPKAKTLLGQ